MMKKLTLLSLSCFLCALLHAQDKATVEMADTMRGNGKIYVVVAVVVLILAGLLFYLIRLDKKISNLEKDQS